MKLRPADELKLRGVHPDLIRVVRRAAELVGTEKNQFIITCGVRTMAEQIVLKAKGASQTLKSRHIPGKDGLSKAIDFAATIGGKVKWDWPLYAAISKVFKQAAKDVGVPIEWGGDWVSFKDGPHIQLPSKKYP